MLDEDKRLDESTRIKRIADTVDEPRVEAHLVAIRSEIVARSVPIDRDDESGHESTKPYECTGQRSAVMLRFAAIMGFEKIKGRVTRRKGKPVPCVRDSLPSLPCSFWNPVDAQDTRDSRDSGDSRNCPVFLSLSFPFSRVNIATHHCNAQPAQACNCQTILYYQF